MKANSPTTSVEVGEPKARITRRRFDPAWKRSVVERALQPGASLDLAVVRTALKDALANYKIPKLILFAGTLPRNAMGKVQKNILRTEYRAQWDAFLAG